MNTAGRYHNIIRSLGDWDKLSADMEAMRASDCARFWFRHEAYQKTHIDYRHISRSRSNHTKLSRIFR
jgi:hypothetical protein